jgi:hypothetical protein
MEAYDYLKIMSIMVCLLGLYQAFRGNIDYRDTVIIVWLILSVGFYAGAFLFDYGREWANSIGATLRLYGYVMTYYMLRRFKYE